MIRIVRIAAENESVRTGFESRLSDAQEAQGKAHDNGSTWGKHDGPRYVTNW